MRRAGGEPESLRRRLMGCRATGDLLPDEELDAELLRFAAATTLTSLVDPASFLQQTNYSRNILHTNL